MPSGWEYRLPTEAQWEYACRAGTRTAFAYGPALRSGMANFNGHYEYPPCGGEDYWCYNFDGIWLGRTAEVGSYLPNAWGLYDMHGNGYEWCQDWYGSYSGGSVTDPQGARTGWSRVLRGSYWGYRGDWLARAWYCRSACRRSLDPEFRYSDLGFRVALVSVP